MKVGNCFGYCDGVGDVPGASRFEDCYEGGQSEGSYCVAEVLEVVLVPGAAEGGC